MVKKAVDAKAKAKLLLTSLIQKIDQRAPYSNRSTHTIASKIQTQRFSIKDLKVKEPKSKPITFLYSEDIAIFDKVLKKRMKKWQKKKREKKEKDKDFTLATENNAIDIPTG